MGLSEESFRRAYGVAPPEGYAPRYNVTPGRGICALRADESGAREAAWLRWGLLPPWARDERDAGAQINARSETAARKPMFRDAFARRRCLIPADGFYEWQRAAAGKQAWFLGLPKQRPFAFAGLWQRLSAAGARAVDSCAILTADAPATVAAIHHRVPVLLPANLWSAWLDPALRDPERVRRLLAEANGEALQAYKVGTRVNRPTVDDPACRAPLADAPPAQGTLF